MKVIVNHQIIDLSLVYSISQLFHCTEDDVICGIYFYIYVRNNETIKVKYSIYDDRLEQLFKFDIDKFFTRGEDAVFPQSIKEFAQQEYNKLIELWTGSKTIDLPVIGYPI